MLIIGPADHQSAHKSIWPEGPTMSMIGKTLAHFLAHKKMPGGAIDGSVAGKHSIESDMSGHFKQPMWICTNCWALRHRLDIEKSSMEKPANMNPSHWKCKHCGTVGIFVSESNEQFALCAIDMEANTWRATLKQAGYPIFSYLCMLERHEECMDKATDEIRCDCPCHAP